VQIPWDAEPAPDGTRVSDGWRTNVLVCGLSEEFTLDKAHRVLDHAVQRRRLIEHLSRRVFCTPQLEPRALVASVTT
jgi:hypothetical protein